MHCSNSDFTALEISKDPYLIETLNIHKKSLFFLFFAVFFSIMARRQLYAFGCANDGQLGFGLNSSGNDAQMKLSPQVLYGAPTGQLGVAVKAVATGEKHTLFLAKDGKVCLFYLCWFVYTSVLRHFFFCLTLLFTTLYSFFPIYPFFCEVLRESIF